MITRKSFTELVGDHAPQLARDAALGAALGATGALLFDKSILGWAVGGAAFAIAAPVVVYAVSADSFLPEKTEGT